MSKTIKGIILTLIAAVCWGLSGVAGEALMSDGDITSEWLVPVRLLSAGALLMTHQAMVHKRHIFDVFKSPGDIVDLAVYSLCGIMLCQYTYFFTIERSNAGTATVLQYVAPVFIMAYTCLKEKRYPRFSEMVCVCLAVTGVFLIATNGNLNSLAISPAALVVGLLSAVTVAIYSLQPIRLLKRFSPLYLLSWAFVVGGIVLAVIFKLWQYSPELNIQKLCLLAVTSVVGSIFGYGLYLSGLRLIGSTKACLTGSAEPVAAALFSAVFVGTSFSGIDIIGFALIISTVIIITRVK